MIYEKPRLIMLSSEVWEASGDCISGISTSLSGGVCQVGVHAPGCCESGNGADPTCACQDGTDPGVPSGTKECLAGGGAGGVSPQCNFGGDATTTCSTGYSANPTCSGGSSV